MLKCKLRIVYLLVFLIYYVAGNSDTDAEIEDKKRRMIEQLMSTRPVILEGYQLVTRHVGIDVYMYRSYRTVSLVFYRVVNDVSDARFTFQSEELHLNNIGIITIYQTCKVCSLKVIMILIRSFIFSNKNLIIYC